MSRYDLVCCILEAYGSVIRALPVSTVVTYSGASGAVVDSFQVRLMMLKELMVAP